MADTARPSRVQAPDCITNTPKLTGNRCQCPTCGEYFNGLDAFDHHRIGNYAKGNRPNTRRCLAVAELEAAGFVRNAAGFWMTDSNAQRAARRSVAGVQAPRAHRAMVLPTPAPDAPESRARAAEPSQSAISAMP